MDAITVADLSSMLNHVAMSEIGLKFAIDGPTTGRLWERARKLRLAKGGRTTRKVRSIYLDTPEHALKNAGIALHLRRDGRRWMQSVETEAALPGPLETPAPGGRPRLLAIPEAGLREEIVRHVNGSPLQTVCETLFKRTARELSLGDGTRAELAVDEGEIHANGRSAPWREAAIELIEGRPGGLFDIVQALFPDGGLRFSRLSRAARGYLLAETGEIEPPVEPRNAASVALDPAQTAEQAARDIVRECFDQIAANVVAAQKLDDPEGPHQLRVALRRLRSAFSLFSPVLQSPELTRLGQEARWLGQEVGRLRDLDVVANDIVGREADGHPEEPALGLLSGALAQEAAERRRLLRECLCGTRVQALLIGLARFVETRGWLLAHDFGQTERLAAPVGELAEGALAKRWKKVGKRAHGLETLDADQRHELRKELKKLRYAVEFLSPLFPTKRVERFAKRLKRLQTVFGELNDAAAVKAMFAGNELRCVGDPDVQRGIGWVVGASQARADSGWARAKDLWRRLENTPLFWR
jgi:inorganic triphosphatase YgiF